MSNDGNSKLRRLRTLNLIAAAFFTAQVILILLLAEPVSLPVLGSYLANAPGADQYGSTELFSPRIDVMVAVFLGLAAIDHFAVGTFARGWCERNVSRGVNPARWWEYSISASLMIVLIAMLTGVSDVVAVLALFGVNAAMTLFGLVMERVNLDREGSTGTPSSTGYSSPCSCSSTVSRSTCGSPTAAVDAGGTPFFAERVYVFLSLFAKTALAWQVYSGALAGS